MDFTLTETQLAFRERARTLAQEVLLPGYQARERAGRIEPELRREIGGLGLIAPELPPELGGRGTDRLTTGVVTEEVGRGDLPVAYLQVVGSLVGQILASNAPPEVAKEWVPRICSGEQIVGIGLTEPHAGSDAGMPRLTAVRDGDDVGARRDQVAVVRHGRRGGRGVRPHRTLAGAGPRHQRVPGPARPPRGAAANRSPTWAPRPSPAGSHTSTGCASPPTTCSASPAGASPRSCRASTSAAR